MPTYLYACSCGLKKELPRPIAERDYPALCECGEDMERQVAGPGFNFRGGGWTGKSNRGRSQ